MIKFNQCSISDLEREYIVDALNRNPCGDGFYTKYVYKLFDEKLGVKNMLLTTSCSTALDMCAMLADIGPGDEVILPSYTFVSTANAFVLRGAKPVFCDIEPDTLNIDPSKIEELITSKTKAIAVVHYAGVICDMEKILDVAKRHKLVVIEDAAQAVGSLYKGKYLAGTIGDMGCYSFHETKNYTMGEGGAILLKERELFNKAEIIREKGTDRSQFMRGEVDKYTWRAAGSSYLPSDILSALLAAQMERFDEIMNKRMKVWNTYHKAFEELEMNGFIRRPIIPDYSTHNAHMYYILVKDEATRNEMLTYLKNNGVYAVFHYIPLHTSAMGESFGYKVGDLPITENIASRIIRLPLYADMTEEEMQQVIVAVRNYLTKGVK